MECNSAEGVLDQYPLYVHSFITPCTHQFVDKYFSMGSLDMNML